jgi:L-fuculose-phosphate aldolase
MKRIYAQRLTTTSGGNLSIRMPDGSIWITPAGVDKGALEAADMVRVLPDGTTEGEHRPSSELPFHQAVYAIRPDLTAMIHAHSPGLVSYSCAGILPDPRWFPQAARVTGRTGIAPYALPGSAELGSSVASIFAQGCDSVVLENHGVCCGGTSLGDAFLRFELFERCAQIGIAAAGLGTPIPLTDAELALSAPHDDPGQQQEEPWDRATRQAATELCTFLHRAYRQGLLVGLNGSFSCRVDARSFLVTPRDRDRLAITPNDLVLVRDGKWSRDDQPSRAVDLHAALYRRHPDAGAVINAFPVCATAFSVCHETLDTRTIPESYVFLREANHISYPDVYLAPDEVASRLTLKRPAAILFNNGVMTIGRTLLAAFDHLEVLECTAESLLGANRLGGYKPMDEPTIAGLRQAFRMDG